MFKSHLQAVNWCDVLHMVTLCLNENKLTANEKSCNTDEGQQLDCSAPRWPLWGNQLRPGDDVEWGHPLSNPPHPQPRQSYGIAGEQVWQWKGPSWSIRSQERETRGFFSINPHNHEPHYHHLDNNHQELVSANSILPVRDQYRVVKDILYFTHCTDEQDFTFKIRLI